ncbi:MAG: glucosidase, partial [Candidatus Eremiobacteraeota bacterium]|nr:glucosidase [Candidatus Eremiobacteraeota bacterium]
GDDYRVEFPTGSGQMLTLWEISLALSRRLVALYRRDAGGRRPFNGTSTLFQSDPHWRDQLLFHEYYHADTGEGLGASHQTGWTGLVAKLIDQLVESSGPSHPHVAADFEVTVRV